MASSPDACATVLVYPPPWLLPLGSLRRYDNLRMVRGGVGVLAVQKWICVCVCVCVSRRVHVCRITDLERHNFVFVIFDDYLYCTCAKVLPELQAISHCSFARFLTGLGTICQWQYFCVCQEMVFICLCYHCPWCCMLCTC